MAVNSTSTRLALNRSGVSTSGTEIPGVEFFWAVELSGENRTHTWKPRDDDLEDDDTDFFSHNLFLKLAVLGEGAVSKQRNMVVLESPDNEGAVVKAPIVHLALGEGPAMAHLDLCLNGRSGGTFTLKEGEGPVHISGSYLMEYPKNELLDGTQTETDESEVEEVEEDGEEEEVDDEKTEEKTGKKGAKEDKNLKRKAATAPKDKKGKKSKKESEEEDEDEEDEEEEMEEEDEDEDEDDSDYEEVKPTKKGKKPTPPTKDAKKGKETSAKKGKGTPEVVAKKVSRKSK